MVLVTNKDAAYKDNDYSSQFMLIQCLSHNTRRILKWLKGYLRFVKA